MNIITAHQTKNSCYKAKRKMTPKGIVVHSTGANNPKLSRYVDCPGEDGKYSELGKPASKHWNRSSVGKMVHAFIGYDKNEEVKVVNTLPYNYCCWGCGRGKKGSYNYSPAYIQFEICEDNLTDEIYFNTAFNVAAEYCAFLCETYGLSVNNIVSHREAHIEGYASNHADCNHWLKNFGKDMNWFRAQVATLLNPGGDDDTGDEGSGEGDNVGGDDDNTGGNTDDEGSEGTEGGGVDGDDNTNPSPEHKCCNCNGCCWFYFIEQ